MQQVFEPMGALAIISKVVREGKDVSYRCIAISRGALVVQQMCKGRGESTERRPFMNE